MVTRTVLALLIVLVANPAVQAGGLVVHEWGTFTSIAGPDGAALEWRPLEAPSDLPHFVNVALPKGAFRTTVRMETPVLYFYADGETDVSVHVDFPKGHITEWYPSARRTASALEWRDVRVLPGANVPLPAARGESHYYSARDTDAAPLRVRAQGSQHEKFLFYRGVGSFALPLLVRLEGDLVRVRNASEDAISEVILFESRDGILGYGIHSLAGGDALLERPALNATRETLRLDLEELLIRHGLYEKEARAMLETWDDSWFETGLRVFYVLSRAATDRILPIRVKPEPAEMGRVLVGRTEVVTPEAEATLAGHVRDLDHPSADVSDAAREALRRHGRFADPMLRRILATTGSARMRARIERLLLAGPDRHPLP